MNNRNKIVKPILPCLEVLLKKDVGMALTPWVLLYFFIGIFLFLLIFCHSMHLSTRYIVEDGLASAALAGEVVDLDVFSQCQELIITDLDYTKEVFWDSLQASLQLSDQGYPSIDSVYFDKSVPVRIEELTIYNVANEQVFKTNALAETGRLAYDVQGGLSADDRCILQGNLMESSGQYGCQVTMLDGDTKDIKNTSLYAKISFGVKGYDQSVIIVEKDILTDIQFNE